MNVVGENKFEGKDAVIENCEKTAAYFATVTTNFETLNIIFDNNHVVITGTAEFIKDNTQVAFISASDIYEFDNNNKQLSVNSYCIQHFLS